VQYCSGNTNGTNKQHNVIDIYNVHLYEATKLLSVLHNLYDKLLVKRRISNFFLQWNPSFTEMLDQVHLGCKRLMSKSGKIWSKYLLINCIGLLTFWMPFITAVFGFGIVMDFVPLKHRHFSSELAWICFVFWCMDT